MQSPELVPGEELDRAVAKATFRPSTDLNAAFAAANAVGFFKWPEQAFVLGYRDDGLWSVQDMYHPSDCYKGATPALAICAAILELKGASDAGRTL